MKKRLSELKDEEVIKDFQDNNTPEAYEILVKRYKDPLMNFVFRFVGDKDACTDIVQDTMIKFYLNKDSYKSFARFSTWIYTIAGNLAKNELKRRKRRKYVPVHSGDDDDYQIQIEDKSFFAPDRQADSSIKDDIIQKGIEKSEQRCFAE